MTTYDIENWVRKLGIKPFRGVFMREALPTTAPKHEECAIINLGDVRSNGTHWVCYIKTGNYVVYFDSYGDSSPPTELKNYIGVNNTIWYNTYGFQNYGDPPICGHLCLEVLRRFAIGEDWNAIEDALRYNKYAFSDWYSTCAY